jgi:hypothetical protein
MRKVSGILLVLGVMGALLVPGLARSSAANLVAANGTEWLEGSWPNATGTPRAALPFILRDPTLTPTNTPTATKTPTQAPATATRTGVPGKTSLEGRLVMQKGRYFTHREWIWFHIQLYNPTGQPLPYTILGVNVWRDNQFTPDTDLGFHTSWTAGPDYVLSGCWGPNGFTDWNKGANYRCAPNASEGWHTDHIGDASNIEIEVPGTYRVVYWACVSSYNSCRNQGGQPDWRLLGEASFIADPGLASAQDAETATPMPQTTCFLNTEDPNNIYLECDE